MGAWADASDFPECEWKSNTYIILMLACVCVCVRVRGGVCVCVCMLRFTWQLNLKLSEAFSTYQRQEISPQ